MDKWGRGSNRATCQSVCKDLTQRRSQATATPENVVNKHVIVRKSIRASALKAAHRTETLLFTVSNKKLSHNDCLCLKRIGHERPVLQSRTRGASHGPRWMIDRARRCGDSGSRGAAGPSGRWPLVSRACRTRETLL